MEHYLGLGGGSGSPSIQRRWPYSRYAQRALFPNSPVIDVLIATDVFEHVPIRSRWQPARPATCAWRPVSDRQPFCAGDFPPPPQLFHLSIGWDQAMREMGLQPLEKVQYGRAFGRTGRLTKRRLAWKSSLGEWPWVFPPQRSLEPDKPGCNCSLRFQPVEGSPAQSLRYQWWCCPRGLSHSSRHS